MKNAHKKSVELLSLNRYSEVFDYLCSPITTYKPTPNGESVVALFWRGFMKVVEVFRIPDKLLRFFLFYDVHTKLCAMFHWQLYLLILRLNRLQIYDFFLKRQNIFLIIINYGFLMLDR